MKQIIYTPWLVEKNSETAAPGLPDISFSHDIMSEFNNSTNMDKAIQVQLRYFSFENY